MRAVLLLTCAPLSPSPQFSCTAMGNMLLCLRRSSLAYSPLFDDKEPEHTDTYSHSLPPYRGLYYKTYKY